MKVLFGTLKIQKGRRIALDQEVLENLELAVGDSVKIYLDTDQLCLVLEPKKETSNKTVKITQD